MIRPLLGILPRTLFSAVMFAGAALPLSSSQCHAAEIVIDTDALTITVDNQPWDFGGSATLGSSFVNNQGIAEFRIGGDLNLLSGDTLRGVGSRPLTLLVGNNVNIASGASIDFSAIENLAGPGGGSSGSGGAGGMGGDGGEAAGGGLGGTGGFGSFGFGPIPIGAPPLVKATIGTAGFYTNQGEDGFDGLSGGAGGAGYGGTYGGQATGDRSSTYGVQTAMRPAEGGQTGLWPPIPSPIPGLQLLLPEFLKSRGKDALVGVDGVNGSNGAMGLRGANGSNSINQNDFSLTGGGAGAGGSGGSGGQGAQSGSGGAGGGGGQGDWVNQIGPPPFFPWWVGVGGEGGDGGEGGSGGIGGAGGTGGSGGFGGAGGGAFEINALGEVRFDGQALAQGGNGTTGTGPESAAGQGSTGTAGSNGQALGIPGFSFSPFPKKIQDLFVVAKNKIPVLKPSLGQPGGDGGAGGAGGDGGVGGAGGAGGGGAGGTVKLVGSTVVGSGNIDTSGGVSGDGVSSAGGGRLLVGANNITPGESSTSIFATTGTQSSNTQGGNLSLNPFVTNGPVVPNMTNLVGGAEAFGLTTLQADTTHFGGESFLENSPAASVVGAIRLDTGPDEYMQDFDGHDMVLVFNARTDGLTNVRFGMNLQELDEFGVPVPNVETGELAPFYVNDLLEGGWANDPAFGGLGDVVNGSLAGYEVYAALVPEDTPTQGLNIAIMAENAGNTFVATLDQFVNGQTLFAEFDPAVPVLESTWIGPTGTGGAGNWNTATHWATVDENGAPVPSVVPNNSTAEAYNVIINTGDAQVSQDTVITIDSLSIGAGDQLSVMDSQRLVLERFSVRPTSGMIENHGVILLDASTAETALRLSGTGIKFAGSGMLLSTDNQNNKLSGIRNTDGFTQYAGHSIEMVGILGANTLTVTNKGTIQALDSALGNSLVIDPSGNSSRASASFVNEGMLVADGPGSKLVLVDGHFQNKNGATIGAYNGSELELQNVMFDVKVGSTLEVQSSSTLTVSGDLDLPEGAVIQGASDTQMNFSDGYLKNKGQILNPGGALTLHNMEIDNQNGILEMHLPSGQFANASGYLYLRDGLVRGEIKGSVDDIELRNLKVVPTATGSGDVELSGASSTILEGVLDINSLVINGSDQLTIDHQTTITGAAYLDFTEIYGSDSDSALLFENPSEYSELIGFIMDGVTVESNGELYAVVQEWYLAAPLTNRGILTAESTLFSDGVIENEGALLQAEFGVSMEFVELRGGTLEVTSDILSAYDSTFINVTLSGGGDFEFGGTMILDNVTNNAGLIIAEEVELKTRFTNNGIYESNGDIFITDDLTIDGFGEMYLYGGISGSQETLTLKNQIIVFDGSSTGSSIGDDQLTLVSDSDIRGISGDPYSDVIDPAGNALSPLPGFINQGVISDVMLQDGYFENTNGTLENVILANVRIVGGNLQTNGSGTGEVIIDGDSSLENVTIDGIVSVFSNLSLRGTIGTNSTADFYIDGGNLVIEEDTVLESINLDITSDFEGGLLGNPSVTLTIDSSSSLNASLLSLSNSTPTIQNHGYITVESLEGTFITTTVPAGTTYSEIAYVLETGGDPTGIDPSSTIALPETLNFTGLARLKNTGTIEGSNGLIDLSQVVIENEGTLDAELFLVESVIKNDGDPISIGYFDSSRVIGGEIDSTYASILDISGIENYLIDTNLFIDVTVASSDLTMVGSSPEESSGLPSQAAVINSEVFTATGSSIKLVGNVDNYSFMSLQSDSTLEVDATLPDSANPSAFTGFVNYGEIEMFGGDATFQGRAANDFSMVFIGTTVTFGPGQFNNYGELTIDSGITLSDPDSAFMADNFSTLTTPSFDLMGGTLIADSSWIDSNLTQLNWASGGVRLTGAAGHTVGSSSIVDGLIGGSTSSIGPNRKLSVDQTLSIPIGTSLQLAGGELRAGTIEVEGTFTFSSGVLSVDTIDSDLTNIAGTLAPGQSPGSTTVLGAYEQQAGASLEIELGGTLQGSEYDSLQVTGTASLSGALDVVLLEDYIPSPGDTFEILAAATGITGTFTSENLPAGYAWDLDYGVTTPNAITLEFLALIGDMDGNSEINLADVNPFVMALSDRDAFLLAYPTVNPLAAGDINQDGQFNLGDVGAFKALLSNSSSASSSSVPEPSTLSLAALLLAFASLTYRRKA